MISFLCRRYLDFRLDLGVFPCPYDKFPHCGDGDAGEDTCLQAILDVLHPAVMRTLAICIFRIQLTEEFKAITESAAKLMISIVDSFGWVTS